MLDRPERSWKDRLCQEPSKYKHEAANACQFFSIKWPLRGKFRSYVWTAFSKLRKISWRDDGAAWEILAYLMRTCIYIYKSQRSAFLNATFKTQSIDCSSQAFFLNMNRTPSSSSSPAGTVQVLPPSSSPNAAGILYHQAPWQVATAIHRTLGRLHLSAHPVHWCSFQAPWADLLPTCPHLGGCKW